jgi:hypothetical protein
MTDARLPGEWLFKQPWVTLSNDGRALLASYLMWSAHNETDGRVPAEMVTVLPGYTPTGLAELGACGVLAPDGDGWQWGAEWGASQTTAARLQGYRKGNAERQARYRESKSNGVSNALPRGRQAGRLLEQEQGTHRVSSELSNAGTAASVNGTRPVSEDVR